MFLKKSEFKKLLKEAYKGIGLTVGAVMGPTGSKWYQINGSYWRLFVKDEFFPKEAKAAVIELTGELPEVDECFTAREKEATQYELSAMTYEEMAKTVNEAKKEFKVTHMIEEGLTRNTRFLQAECGTLLGINNVFISLIDNSSIDYEKGECTAEGPLAYCADALSVLWKNNACVLQVWTRKPRETEEEDVMMWDELKEICLY